MIPALNGKIRRNGPRFQKRGVAARIGVQFRLEMCVGNEQEREGLMPEQRGATGDGGE